MDIHTLLSKQNLSILDVRSEGEFTKGHIPAAINTPLLDDDQRRLVGICYKQKGREEAIILGYQLVGDQFEQKLKLVRDLVKENQVGVYCWRGGLRSKIFSQLLENGGFEVFRLEDGYKVFRRWALELIDHEFPMIVLGGNTGTGKTEILHLLQERGEQIIDLEALAHHKGSAYGGIGMISQPTQEQFENELAMQLQSCDRHEPIWIENESKRLGRINLPNSLYEQMRAASVIEIKLPKALRKQRIVDEYAQLPKEELIGATAKLEKRLGNQNMKSAIDHLLNDEYEEWVEILLAYYDKLYDYGNSLRKKEDVHSIDIWEVNIEKSTAAILKYYDQLKNKSTGSPVNSI